jgi:hypothetical protein
MLIYALRRLHASLQPNRTHFIGVRETVSPATSTTRPASILLLDSGLVVVAGVLRRPKRLN